MACGLLFAWCDSVHGPFAAVFDKPLWNVLQDHSHLTNFLVSAARSGIELPAITRGAAASVVWPASGEVEPAHKPDIVVVLEESTFDPVRLAVCDIAPCRSDLFRPGAHDVAGGSLLVHTFGGGTFTSEFAVLTGLPHSLFGSAGMYAPYRLAPLMHETLPQHLHALGYRNAAVYPTEGGFLNARNAYRHYGFDALHDAAELGLGWQSSDAEVFAAARQVMEAERVGGQPLFLMVLTIY